MVRAIQAATRSIFLGEPVQPDILISISCEYIGRAAIRPDAVTKVTGKVKYIDDYRFSGIFHGRALQPEMLNDVIKKIDISNVEKSRGDLRIL